MRLIDADALIKELEKSHKAHGQNSREESLFRRDLVIIMEQPTAYDVGKVVAELEEYKSTHLEYRIGGSIKHCKEVRDCEGTDCFVCVWNKAIEYVRNGGKE